ncbi:hypothetical protein [Paeniglutamicibacter cryotolerans]|uniref:Uncharacterized protein n=1 Tax=Paeniglutamicibacter cryotolerans TaxID=670079 RepID=A0A839QR65_9MICC|nr:hypothetical protein [Paeniglutamicibacter cryotolerans]MBB2997274.1 hypothetical protein [Paeniglutamicibacter cryotolerans]
MAMEMYWCFDCDRKHRPESDIGREHLLPSLSAGHPGGGAGGLFDGLESHSKPAVAAPAKSKRPALAPVLRAPAKAPRPGARALDEVVCDPSSVFSSLVAEIAETNPAANLGHGYCTMLWDGAGSMPRADAPLPIAKAVAAACMEVGLDQDTALVVAGLVGAHPLSTGELGGFLRAGAFAFCPDPGQCAQGASAQDWVLDPASAGSLPERFTC